MSVCYPKAVIKPATAVDKYQSVAFNGNRYSVPRRYAFEMVTVKGYVDRVVIGAKGQGVASHARSLAKQTMVLDPVHFLAVLDRKETRTNRGLVSSAMGPGQRTRSRRRRSALGLSWSPSSARQPTSVPARHKSATGLPGRNPTRDPG